VSGEHEPYIGLRKTIVKLFRTARILRAHDHEARRMRAVRKT